MGLVDMQGAKIFKTFTLCKYEIQIYAMIMWQWWWLTRWIEKNK